MLDSLQGVRYCQSQEYFDYWTNGKLRNRPTDGWVTRKGWRGNKERRGGIKSSIVHGKEEGG